MLTPNYHPYYHHLFKYLSFLETLCLWGLVMRYWAFCRWYSVSNWAQLYNKKKKTHNCCHLSFHWLLSVEKKEDTVWTDSGAKLQVKFGFRSRFLRVFLLSPPRSQQPPSLTIPESSQCSVLTRQPLPGPPSSLSPSFHQNMLSLLFFILFLK